MKDSKISRFHILIKTQNEFSNSNYEEKFSLDFTIFFSFFTVFRFHLRSTDKGFGLRTTEG